MLEAKDIMTKQVVCIRKDTPIFEAIRMMANNNITGIPVVDDNDKPVGLISWRDILKMIEAQRDK